MLNKLRAFFFEPGDARPLALLRIFMGVMMMAETLEIWLYLDDLYGPYGFLEAGLMNAISGMSAPSFAQSFEARGWDYSVFLHGLFWIRWIFLFTFTLGFWTRTSTLFLCLFQGFIMFSGTLSSYGVDRYFHVFLFLMIWMPCGDAWAFDSGKAIRRSESATYSLRVLQIAMLVTYLNAGVAKMSGFEWWNGDAVWRAVHLPEFRRFTLFWLADYPLIPKMMGWATLLIETLYIVAVWIPGIGLLWTLSIIGMHIGIAITMGLVNFGITMALLNVALFLFGLHRIQIRPRSF